MFKAFRHRLKRAMSVEYWRIAIREFAVPLYENPAGGGTFTLLPGEKYVTYADPFLFEYKGECWLFYERQDLTDMKGSLWAVSLGRLPEMESPSGKDGLSEDPPGKDYSGESPSGKDGLSEGPPGKGCSEESPFGKETNDKILTLGLLTKKPIKAIEEPFHLSYPQVFEWKGRIYMIPESRACGEIRLYECLDFPGRWHFKGALIKEEAVDTTILIEGDDIFFHTYIDNRLAVYKGRLHEGFEGLLREGPKKLWESEPSKTLRPGGRFIKSQGPLIRPSQDCRAYYGNALVFTEQIYDNSVIKPVTELNRCKMLTPSSLKFSKGRANPVGVHTYNRDCGYEVIDILHREISPGVLIKKLQWKMQQVRE